MFRAGRTPIVGREQQVATLCDQLAEVRAGRPGVVLLSGPPGIGKTRLLDEFAHVAEAAGARVLRGGTSQAAGMPPYLPFLELLGDYIATTPPERLREQLGPHAAILATLLPELHVQLGDVPPPYRLPPEQARFRLYEAVAGFVAAIAGPRLLVLLLDDLQWADAATCDLLVHLVSHSRASPVLIAGAYRDGDAEDNPAFLHVLAELNRRRLLLLISLPALEAAASHALAANLLHGDVNERALDLLHRHGAGNPFFLEELLRAMVEDGTLAQSGERWELTRASETPLPRRIAEAVQTRLERLDPAVGDLLRIAAVTGRSGDANMLAAASGEDEERVEELLRAAERRQLLRLDPDGSYTFTHDLVRETLQAEVTTARRRRLHLAIGIALEARDSEPTLRHLADLAFHFAEAGEHARGTVYSIAAGEQALRASAATQATAHFQVALRLLEAEGDDPSRAAALTGLGAAATQAGAYPAAAEAYLDAQQTWLRSGDAHAAARAWHELGRVRWRQEAISEARAAFERALELFGPGDDTNVAETLLQLADLHATSLGRNTEGLAYAEQARAMVERLGDRKLEATACAVAGNVKARGNDLETGRALLEHALALARELDEPALAAEVCAYLANIYAWTADVAQSIEISRLRASLAQRTQDVFHLRHVYSWIGLQHALQGRWADAEQSFAEQERIVEGLPSPEPRAAIELGRGIMHYFQGRFVEGAQRLSEIVEFLRPTASTTIVWYLGWYGLHLVELGRDDEALACLAEAYALADSLDAQARARGAVFAQIAVACAQVGASERAAACYAKLLPFRGQVSPILIDHGLGVAALAAGDLALAQEHLQEARIVAERGGLLPELALVLLRLGDIDTRGESVALREGLRICAELSMDAHSRAVRGQHALGGHQRRGSGIAGLSERELEVLRLVARGATNREIAEALFLSEKTVARHLTHIYTKTGVDNRTGAAAFALRHNLA
jgi:predicted ATPase/DNA-binding CsgD family transcriptional regulator